MAQVRPVLSIKDSEVTSSECFLGLLFPQMLNCSDKLFKQVHCTVCCEQRFASFWQQSPKINQKFLLLATKNHHGRMSDTLLLSYNALPYFE